ncbi:cystine transport system permease protein [Pullulanibacillus pueri]|uniref:Putative amino-acid ABC transporter permease protein YckA n=1 Tax=Pullulanibacillus pueri TaxID=1437324 RepID=A0A8J2ZYU0_9BACL|nr:ABC transporter permease subunit [Pullulanibacillus pueri]MBM7683754.1 cystine transport system permease protein [Pullulanibacillus pueri]GGH87341.1 putative amino-acid ABC transporter permease protein YckA [Pullulanibacillus pueri]
MTVDPWLAIKSFPYVVQGVGNTLLISVVSMGLGLILSLFLALMRNSDHAYLRWPARFYISFMRGTPIIVFLFILYMGLPVVGIDLDAITAALIGFSLNSAGYMAEINRAAINAIPKEQWEGAIALGLKKWQTLFYVILPQAIRIAIPSLGNVFLDLVKSSSLAATISVSELFQKAQVVAGRTLDSFTMYILVAIIYWVVCVVISGLQNYLEKRMTIDAKY